MTLSTLPIRFFQNGGGLSDTFEVRVCCLITGRMQPVVLAAASPECERWPTLPHRESAVGAVPIRGPCTDALTSSPFFAYPYEKSCGAVPKCCRVPKVFDRFRR